MAETRKADGLRGLISATGGDGRAGDTVERALQAVRSHLGMEVAYVSEFVAGRSVFRAVDAPGREALIKVGDSHSLDDVYCRHILEGRLPELIPDTTAEPLAMAMPITHAVPIGAHVSVPIRLPDGRLYGMFCCLGFEADRSLNERDLQMMKAFADLTAFEINRDLAASKAAEERRTRIRDAIDKNQLSIAYQPIWDVDSHRPVGFECLARFSAAPARSPDSWFAEAAEAGLGAELEIAATRTALSAFTAFPDSVYLAINAAPATIISSAFQDAIRGLPPHRIVVEVTEHTPVDDYERLRDSIQPLRAKGLRLAVDDAGAGYSSLRRILHLRPDLIKLDMDLTRNVDLDPARRALASALIAFTRETGSRIIAEGVETASELATLRALGIEQAQGFFLARPMPLENALKLCRKMGAPELRVA